MNNEGVLGGCSRLGKKRKQNNKIKTNTPRWACGLVGCLGLSGPMGHVGPVREFRESGYVPIILVSSLENFRRLRDDINNVR